MISIGDTAVAARTFYPSNIGDGIWKFISLELLSWSCKFLSNTGFIRENTGGNKKKFMEVNVTFWRHKLTPKRGNFKLVDYLAFSVPEDQRWRRCHYKMLNNVTKFGDKPSNR
ncbi:uncharacterized protein [Fopius arisanus]|uniref:Uncharacterized protein n=2 Tax=Fopius arisanus TaxID=64838 RepID=A0A9R1TC10_9HYME|nr:PREDICTED: uncharacterized protein LOC105268467 [Fopius arisanus]